MNIYWNLALNVLLMLSITALSIAWFQRTASRLLKSLALAPAGGVVALMGINFWFAFKLDYLWPAACVVTAVFLIGTLLVWRLRARLVSWVPIAVLAASLFALRSWSTHNLRMEATVMAASLKIEAGQIAQRELPPRARADQNAASTYKRLAKLIMESASGALEEDEPSQASRAALKQMTPQLEELRQATRMPACSFESEDSQLPEINLLEIVHLARALNQSAIVAIEDGQRAIAFINIRALLDLSEHLIQTPTLGSLNVVAHVRTLALNALARLEPTDSEMQSLRGAWTALASRKAAAFALEEAFVIGNLAAIPAALAEQLDPTGMQTTLFNAVLLHEVPRYREHMRQARELVVQDQDALISEHTERLFEGNLLLPLMLSAHPARIYETWKACDRRLEPYQANAAATPR
jgi:hypothetical protein